MPRNVSVTVGYLPPPPDPLIDPATPAGAQPTWTTGRTLVMSEEFDGAVSVADSTAGLVRFREGGPTWATWYPDWPRFNAQSPGGNHTNTDQEAYYATDQVSTGSSALRLSMTKTPNNGMDYKGGMIQSLPFFTPQYGYFEARIRTDHINNGIWAAWWMSCSNFNEWPPEIDIWELYEPGIGILANVYKPGIGVYTVNVGASSLALSYHTYGCRWTPTDVTFFLDGVQVGASRTTNIPDTQQYLILNHGAQTTSNPSWTSGLMEVDYVRVWV